MNGKLDRKNEPFIYVYFFFLSSNKFTREDIARRLLAERPCGPYNAMNLGSNLTQDYFTRAVGKIIEYIHAGDVYQVNFSQRFEADFSGDPFSLYKTLCEINPSPFR